MDPTFKRASGIVAVVLPVIACLAVYTAVASMPGRRPLIEPRALADQSVSSVTPGPGTPVQTAAPELPLAEVSLPGAALANAVPTLTPAPAISPMRRGRDLTTLLYGNRIGQLWEAFQPSARREWGTLSDFQAYRQGGISAYGRETKVVSETVQQAGNISYYTRTSTFERGPESGWTVIFALDPAGQVVDFGIVAADVLPAAMASTGP